MSKLKYANGNRPMTEEQKQQMIEEAAVHYGHYMDALNIDWRNDPNSADTPLRVAKSFVNDLAAGCYNTGPNITAFDNVDKYDGIIFQGNITVHSFCSHHHLPFIGQAHVAYLPSEDGKIIGLSKLNRIVEFYSRRPQVQENLTMQIHKHIVMVEANHLCACVRGVKHNATMKTTKLSDAFKNVSRVREEFYNFIRDLK
mgnify:CR=1 FL=1